MVDAIYADNQLDNE